KDVETIRPPELAIAAILPRADIRDVLVGAASIAELPHGARVGTGAPRRAAQLLNLRPDCAIVPFRGNVATRLARIGAGEADATFLAAAGLERLGLKDVGSMLEPCDWLPAAAQGAIGIECRSGDTSTMDLLAAIDHPASRNQVLAERALLEGLGGSCHSPVAALCTGEDKLAMRAALFSGDGRDKLERSVEFAARDLAAARALAQELLECAGPAIRKTFAGRP
ncbi:MAG TPA: hydroxymethylbilane synthase, partial [Sphingomonadaceae bacterium]|nr:hydroxymethylbilane synthase [Sphingomonadaceae bacterium]